MTNRRTSLTSGEIVDVMRFVADVAARKSDPLAQRQFLVDGMMRIGGADIGFAYTAVDWLPGRAPRMVSGVTATGCADVFATYVRDVLLHGGHEQDPYCMGTLHRRDDVVLVNRNDVIGGLEATRWYGVFDDWGRRCNLGDGTIALARLDAAKGTLVGTGIHRLDRGRRPFGPRERARVRLATSELAGLVARGHLPTPELDGAGPLDPADGLPPRPRAVLRLMLAGVHTKAIAGELGIAVDTLREHQARLYRHFGVSGRDELMARFVRA
jgi:DNA-binding CsgD family transcriptional regulator